MDNIFIDVENEIFLLSKIKDALFISPFINNFEGFSASIDEKENFILNVYIVLELADSSLQEFINKMKKIDLNDLIWIIRCVT